MLVFPVNNDAYRSRKRAHKACQQCKRKRRRCRPALDRTYAECQPCLNDDIACSFLSPEEDSFHPQPQTQSHSGSHSETKIQNQTSSYEDAKTYKNPPPRSRRRFSQTSNQYCNNRHLPTSSRSAPELSIGSNKSSSYQISERSSNAGRNFSGDRQLQYGMQTFIGEMNPCSELLSYQKRSRDLVGVWVSNLNPVPVLEDTVRQYLHAIEAFSIPENIDRQGLIDLYFQSVNAVFPILDLQEFNDALHNHNISLILVHCTLLVAANHPMAQTFLRELPADEFRKSTMHKVRALLHAQVETDRLNLCRAHALLSLCSDSVADTTSSAMDIKQAIHYAMILGIHQERSYVNGSIIRRLFWTLFCIDRISASVNAQAVTINLEDVGLSWDEPKDTKFGSLLSSCLTLDEVIRMYRPCGEKFPVNVSEEYENKISIDASGDIDRTRNSIRDLPTFANCPDKHERGIVASLHILHYSIFISAHKRVDNSNDQTMTQLKYVSARILEIVSTYKDILPPLPFIPFAVSQTFTVFLKIYPETVLPQGFTWQDAAMLIEYCRPFLQSVKMVRRVATVVFGGGSNQRSLESVTGSEEEAEEFSGQTSPTRVLDVMEPKTHMHSSQDVQSPSSSSYVSGARQYASDFIFGETSKKSDTGSFAGAEKDPFSGYWSSTKSTSAYTGGESLTSLHVPRDYRTPMLANEGSSRSNMKAEERGEGVEGEPPEYDAEYLFHMTLFYQSLNREREGQPGYNIGEGQEELLGRQEGHTAEANMVEREGEEEPRQVLLLPFERQVMDMMATTSQGGAHPALHELLVNSNPREWVGPDGTLGSSHSLTLSSAEAISENHRDRM
ncbi:hypothetical protein CANCADRAFT_101137 [Tortispora caseinolytica NRRL Y-17796]|uniref:Zn(2)-C6 fungal-type domain-containing protein n=1 Tax=Tortispora caseinolytica NRRL Y-17796 TaxID=767744 RepID=A0A1E4TEB3_9ASCO|nr:hypothetical protein CANCADRAFT_101137 [Tortispora caseinolytica NRRL Y-17796]